MRDFEKLIAEGDALIDQHPQYDMSLAETRQEICRLLDWKKSGAGTDPALEVISRVYNAGIGAGARLARKEKKTA